VRFEHVMAQFNAVLVSGCSQREESSDAEIDGRPNGALTYYLLQTLSLPNGLNQPLVDIVRRTRAALQANHYPQHPQLEGSQELMNQAFLSQAKKAAAHHAA
jgi:metacaspase-1